MNAVLSWEGVGEELGLVNPGFSAAVVSVGCPPTPPPHQGRLFLPQPLLLPFHGWAAHYRHSQIEEAFPILNQNLPSGYL